jgi:arginine exporter protein ArgO
MWLLEVGTTGRLAAVVATVAVLDRALIRVGVTGRGPRPIVQPWSWGRYTMWLAGRAFLFAIAVF